MRAVTFFQAVLIYTWKRKSSRKAHLYVLLFSNKIILIRYQRFCNPFRKINVKPEE
jgi:hypothetical protein